MLSDKGSQVVSVVASKGEDKRQERGAVLYLHPLLQGRRLGCSKKKTLALGALCLKYLFSASPEQKNAGEESLKAFFRT